MVVEEIQNRANSVQFGQIDAFARFSRYQRALGAEHYSYLGKCALGIFKGTKFFISELDILQFSIIEFHSGNHLSFIYIGIITYFP